MFNKLLFVMFGKMEFSQISLFEITGVSSDGNESCDDCAGKASESLGKHLLLFCKEINNKRYGHRSPFKSMQGPVS